MSKRILRQTVGRVSAPTANKKITRVLGQNVGRGSAPTANKKITRVLDVMNG
jgi:hypothetical protein